MARTGADPKELFGHDLTSTFRVSDLRDLDIRVSSSGGWRQLMAGRHRAALAVGVGMNVFQQLTGINVVVYFAPVILTQVGEGLIQAQDSGNIQGTFKGHSVKII
jgi:hypothetical protein